MCTTYLLPRNKVGVMLHARNNNLIARLQTQLCQTCCNKVERFGCIASKHNFLGFGIAARIGGTNKLCNTSACVVDTARSRNRKPVQTTKRVSVHGGIKLGKRLDNRVRTLSGRRAVEVCKLRICSQERKICLIRICRDRSILSIGKHVLQSPLRAPRTHNKNAAYAGCKM